VYLSAEIEIPNDAQILVVPRDALKSCPGTRQDAAPPSSQEAPAAP
jgi:hypothetical protein